MTLLENHGRSGGLKRLDDAPGDLAHSGCMGFAGR